MKKKASAILLAFLLAQSLICAQIKPSATYKYASRDTCDLYLDVYNPAGQSEKPSVIFVFGGGFVGGERDGKGYLPWFEKLTEDGYRVISIDYRLGLKGAGKIGVKNIDLIYNAVEIGVEDLYDATTWLVQNSNELGIDPNALVVSGSSAGAIISLQAVWHIANRDAITERLPKDFEYAGAMSFAGAVFSRSGKVRYNNPPCPTLFLHGTADKVVTYKQISLFRNHFTGSKVLAKTYANNGYNYNILRYDGNGHTIASAFLQSYPEQLRFLETNVAGKEKRIVDALLKDPSIPKDKLLSTKQLYSNNEAPKKDTMKIAEPTAPTQPTEPSVTDQAYSPSTLIIFYDPEVGAEPLRKAINDYKAEVIYEYNNFNGFAISIPKGTNIEDAITYFNSVKGVLAVNRDAIYHLD